MYIENIISGKNKGDEIALKAISMFYNKPVYLYMNDATKPYYSTNFSLCGMVKENNKSIQIKSL